VGYVIEGRNWLHIQRASGLTPACDCMDFLCAFTFCHLIKLELHECEEYKASAVVCIPSVIVITLC
jgi:hypothetical protein